MDIYEPVIAEMRAQIEECQRVIVTLEMMRGKGATGVAPTNGTSTAQAATFTNDSFFGMTIAEAAKKYLTGTKKTATAKVIGDALIAGGFKTAAKNFTETVRSIVSRNPMFAFVNGEFGLAEWYPGRKAPKKVAANDAGDADNGESTSEETDTATAGESTEQPPL